MNSQQNTLIYIEEKDKNEAIYAAQSFADPKTRNRAYMNVLGSELACKYLTSEGIGISPLNNLHNIRKLLEEIDIADVILPRTHIDVRIIFDEKYIFVPKSHFDLGILPHIYLVFQPTDDFTHVKLFEYIQPHAIDNTTQKDDYYFIEKEKLSPVEDLKQYLETAQTSTETEMTDAERENFEESIINLIDNDIDYMEKRILLKVLSKNKDLREKFIEFENFEILAFKAATEIEHQNNEEITGNTDTEITDEFEFFEKNDEIFENLSQTEDVITTETCNDIIGEDLSDENEDE